MSKQSQTIHAYRKFAQKLSDKWNLIQPKGRVSDIAKAFSFIKRKNPLVIELGCGNGRDAKVILEKTKKYLGIDISPELIKIAKRNVPNAKFKVADIEKFNFPKNIDIIFSFASLLHPNKNIVRQILERLHINLNYKGIIFLSLKYGDYGSKTITDQYGKRTYYFYKPLDIQTIIKNKYKIIYKNIQNIRGQKWFNIVLRKSGI